MSHAINPQTANNAAPKHMPNENPAPIMKASTGFIVSPPMRVLRQARGRQSAWRDQRRSCEAC